MRTGRRLEVGEETVESREMYALLWINPESHVGTPAPEPSRCMTVVAIIVGMPN